MPIRTWLYLASRALTGMWRNGVMSIAAVTTVAICLTVLAIVLLLTVNLQYMASFVESQVEIVAYVDPEFDRTWKNQVIAEIEAIPGVESANYFTREEAMDRLKEQFREHAYLLEGLDDPDTNPLRDLVEVRLLSPQYADAVADMLDRIEHVEEVSHRQDLVDKLLAITRLVRVGGIAIAGLLAMATIFIIANTIRLTVYARRHEVSIMKLVGATDGFIRWPFFLEGLILGLAGAGMAALVAWIGYGRLTRTLTEALPFLPVLGGQPLLANLTKVLLLLGALIGAVGSSISLHRFLRV